MITHLNIVDHTIDHLKANEAHLLSFPDTVDKQFALVMLRATRCILDDHRDLFSNPYGQGYRSLTALYNTLATGANDDATTMYWTSRRQFFIYIKIVASKIKTLISDPTRITIGITGPLEMVSTRNEYVLSFKCARLAFTDSRIHPHSNIWFLDWVCDRLCGMAPIQGTKPFFKTLP